MEPIPKFLDFFGIKCNTNRFKYFHIIQNYLQNKNNDWYEMPENVSSLLVNPITGKPATENDEKKKIMYFIKGTEPTDTDTVFDEKIENATLS